LACRGSLHDVEAADADRPAAGPQHARDRAQRGRLAGAVGADQAEDVAGRDGEGELGDGGSRSP
jgi:hypothetical protein